jgi:hypothetical protein
MGTDTDLYVDRYSSCLQDSATASRHARSIAPVVQVSHVLHRFDQLFKCAVAVQCHDGVYVWRLLHIAEVLAQRGEADLLLLL